MQVAVETVRAIQGDFVTFGNYKRLLLVVILPLLLAGYLVSLAAMPTQTMSYRLCQGLGDFENCRNLGEPGDALYDGTKQQSKIWFQVMNRDMDGAQDVYQVEANARTVGRVTVDAVAAYTLPKPTPLGEAQMQSMKGRPALLRMGIEDGQRSAVTDSEIYLFCHTLRLDMEPSEWVPHPGPYTAECVADEWSGRISFTPSPDAEKQLVLLRDAVNAEVNDRERQLLTERVVLTLAPLVLFLVLSGIVWLTRRATAFVKAG
nr:hypothetical protein RKHAN_02532 [Rhizobium sp. Khangiran2]